ncbi:MAG: GDP-mannose 4,6-dehydratase, partial [Elusimicrobiales bacterium]|nr:GDP-mannose 4,6-dehydratase [Elusimicrobiales bacterium]
NIDYGVLRPSNIYGPRQHKGGEGGVVGIFAHNAARNQASVIYGDGTKTRDFVYVGDVVQAILKAKDYKHYGIVNISTGVETSINDLIEAVEKVSGNKFKYEKKPDKPGEVARSVLSNQKAKEHLGWAPKVSLEEGVRQTIDWTKKFYK